MRTDLIKVLVMWAGRLKDRALAIGAILRSTTARFTSTQAALTTRRWDFIVHRIWRSKHPPIVVVLPRIVVFFLEALHIDSWSEFQWTDASNSIVCLIKSFRAYSRLSKHFHFIGSRASNLLPGWAYLDLRSLFGEIQGVFLIILLGWCLFNRFSWSTLLSPLSDNHLWKRFLWSNCFEKLFFVNLLICIQVDPSYNRIVVLFARLLSSCVEESLQVLLVDVAQATVINCLVSCVLAVAFCRFQFLFQFFCVTVHLYLHYDELS